MSLSSADFGYLLSAYKDRFGKQVQTEHRDLDELASQIMSALKTGIPIDDETIDYPEGTAS